MENATNTNDQLNERDFLEQDLSLKFQGIKFLNTIASWANFLAVIGFIFCGLMIIGALGFAFFTPQGTSAPVPFWVFSLVYIIFAIIYIMPCYYLFSFGSMAKKAIKSKNNVQFEQALGYLKSHYLFIGIMTIIFISLYLLFIVIAILGASAFSSYL